MRAILIAARAAGTALLLTGVVLSAEFKLPSTDATPAELVDAALRSELEGPSDVRRSLLDRALELEPDYAPARWQSGYVRWDDEWLTLEEVAQRAASDKRLVEYRQRRDTMIDTADEHRALANWCKKRQLSEESRIHWAKVLEFDPADAEALAALGLQLYEGRLLTKEQIVEAKQQAVQRLQAMKHWQPQMQKWRKALDAGSGKSYNAARQALRELTEVEAVAALEATFAENGTGQKADAANLVLIETVGRMHTPEATQVLLRRAIQPDSMAVRAAACDELKKRPMYAYVPILIGAMPPPSSWRHSYRVTFLPGGFVGIGAEFEQSDGRSVQSISHSALIDGHVTVLSFFNPELRGRRWDIETAMALTSSAVHNIRREALSLQARHERQNALRDRICGILERATGESTPRDRTEWEAWWNMQTESYTPAYNPTERDRNYSAHYDEMRYVARYTQVSCFPAGTAVLTATGTAAIESVKVGDSVVAQDPVSGELTRGIVQATTLRPAAPLVKLTLGSHSLSATRGHPFWVNGQGWTMAKHLQVGQILHGIDGAVRIDAIEALPPREAYNLVVGEFGTYFVGQQPVLVHDNSPLAETTALVPGLDLALAP